MIRNINSSFGDSVEFDSIEQMKSCLYECDYELPEDGLLEGRDYEVI